MNSREKDEDMKSFISWWARKRNPRRKVVTKSGAAEILEERIVPATARVISRTLVVTGNATNEDISVTKQGGTTTFRSGASTQTFGGVSNTKISAAGGDDRVRTSGLPATVFGGAGGDTINGGDNRDSLLGEAGNDSINGGAGDDFIDGGAGRDTLLGGIGDDLIKGGTNPDRMFGGQGSDDFVSGTNASNEGIDSVFASMDDDWLDAETTLKDRIDSDPTDSVPIPPPIVVPPPPIVPPPVNTQIEVFPGGNIIITGNNVMVRRVANSSELFTVTIDGVLQPGQYTLPRTGYFLTIRTPQGIADVEQSIRDELSFRLQIHTFGGGTVIPPPIVVPPPIVPPPVNTQIEVFPDGNIIITGNNVLIRRVTNSNTLFIVTIDGVLQAGQYTLPRTGYFLTIRTPQGIADVEDSIRGELSFRLQIHTYGGGTVIPPPIVVPPPIVPPPVNTQINVNDADGSVTITGNTVLLRLVPNSGNRFTVTINGFLQPGDYQVPTGGFLTTRTPSGTADVDQAILSLLEPFRVQMHVFNP